ncbi:MAG: helix-turn-helix domain-containing protein, partial [Spirochaetota bacterium]
MQKGLVRSVLRSIKILEMLKDERGMTVTDLFKVLHYPKSTIHEIVATLESEGLIEKDISTKKYHLGLKIFELGQRAQSNLEIRRIA